MPDTALDLAIVGASVKRPAASAQSIPNNTGTSISFTDVVFDTANMFDAGTPTRLTAQRAGLYLLAGSAGFVTNATGDRSAGIRLNGATTLVIMTTPTAAGLFWSGSFAVAVNFAVGDFVELRVTQTSGGALNTGDCFLTALGFGTV